MSATAANADLPPILGTKAGDVLSVDTSVTFTWVPDPGDSFTGSHSYFDWENFVPATDTETGPSHASGSVTFDVPSSQSFDFQSASAFSFSFTQDLSLGLDEIGAANYWSWDARTGSVQPAIVTGWYDTGVSLLPTYASFGAYQYGETLTVTDLGHWELAPDPHNVAVFGGAGNDTIYGGQGQEVLSGDAGDDVIYVGRGDDLVFGGAGNDAIHGGVGTQILDGGAGSDTIWGGTGTQTIMGEAGDDLIWAGDGAETVSGGAGSDTIWGGTGSQYLDGGAGADLLHAGSGNETLVGGAGRDVFAFDSGASGQDVIADFHLGQDVLQVAAGFGGLAIARPHDLAAHVAAGPGGNAVLDLGGMSVTLLGISASQVTSHLQQVFKIA